MSIYQASLLADNGLEYEARIANMISEGGIGVEAYYNYEKIWNESPQDLPQEKNITHEAE